MTKQVYIYHVGAQHFTGAVAFGTAWRQAKAAAEATGEPIFRTVVKTRYEVFKPEAGVFLPADPVR